jgi:parvin
VEEIALTAASQRRKLGVVLEAVNRSLQVEEQQAKWSVESMWGFVQDQDTSIGLAT